MLALLATGALAQSTRIWKTGFNFTLAYPADWRAQNDGGPNWKDAMPGLWYNVATFEPPLTGKGYLAKITMMIAHIDPQTRLESIRDQKVEVYRRTQDTTRLSVHPSAMGSLPAYEVSYASIGRVLNVTTGQLEPHPTWIVVDLAKSGDALYVLHFHQFERSPADEAIFRAMLSSFRKTKGPPR